MQKNPYAVRVFLHAEQVAFWCKKWYNYNYPYQAVAPAQAGEESPNIPAG